MAISKKHKNELVDQYVEWIKECKALYLTEYTGLRMKDIDELRRKCREAGGEFHIVKNTLGQVAFSSVGWEIPGGYFEGSTAIGFAFKDAAAMAKIMSETARTSEFVKIKGGYLDQRPISAKAVKDLAELPPLPVMRAQLLGTLLAPAGKLVRTLAEPARSLAAVMQAYAEKSGAAAEA